MRQGPTRPQQNRSASRRCAHPLACNTACGRQPWLQGPRGRGQGCAASVVRGSKRDGSGGMCFCGGAVGGRRGAGACAAREKKNFRKREGVGRKGRLQGQERAGRGSSRAAGGGSRGGDQAKSTESAESDAATDWVQLRGCALRAVPSASAVPTDGLGQQVGCGNPAGGQHGREDCWLSRVERRPSIRKEYGTAEAEAGGQVWQGTPWQRAR